MVNSVIELWLEAEEENRLGNDKKCQDLKKQFSNEWEKLSLVDKQYVVDYLDEIGG